MRVLLLYTFLLCSACALGQERKPWVVRAVNKLGAFIDTMATSGIDKRYIEVPERPWQVMLKFNANDMDLRSSATLSQETLAKRGITGENTIEAAIKPNMSTSIGLWVGYRGYGLGYSYSISGKDGSNFSFGAMGSNYGINLRIKSFSTREMDIHQWGFYEEGFYDEKITNAELWDDVNIRSAILDGYYMFNGKRFSYAAAYDQSVKQIHSAGSFLIGAMWFQTTLDYAQRLNAPMVQIMGNIGYMKIQEGALGAGYAYNWVPVKNLLFNITAMPMLVLYNRVKVKVYDSNYDIFLYEDDPTTGKKAILDDDDSWTDDITIDEVASMTRHSKITLNYDARVSLTYNWNRYFVNVYGQWNNFRNKYDSNTLKLNDWYVNASLGIRL